MELKPWAIDSRAPKASSARGEFWEGGGVCVRGERSQNWCQAAQPNQGPASQSVQTVPKRTAASHDRPAHAICTTHSCCVNVMSLLVSCQLAAGKDENGSSTGHAMPCDAMPGRDRTGQDSTKCARYSQLIRIIECQACGTEGTEWRRRGPLSLCAPSLPCCVGVLSVALCLCLCLYLCPCLCSSTCLS